MEKTPEVAEVLVSVALPKPGEQGWDRGMTNAIRQAVRATAVEARQTMPLLVVTTRITQAEDDA